MTREIATVAEALDGIEGILIDQFGVLHDGQAPFPGALDCAEWLAARLPMVALTNSGKRAGLNLDRLERVGFPRRLFRAMVSSGELAHGEMAAMLADGRLAPGDGIAVLSHGGDTSVIDGLPLRAVGLDAGPRLLLLAGGEPERFSRADYAAMLAPLAAAGVPALCVNPDLLIYAGGRPSFGIGAVAEDYRAAGGAVTMLGKPGAAMFGAGLAALGLADPARCLMIGDSPDHDIAGAREAGCRTLLITGGVQARAGETAGADFAMARLVCAE